MILIALLPSLFFGLLSSFKVVILRASSPYANNNVLRRNSLQRIVFYSGQRIVLPTPSGALLDLIMCISQGP
jgi:hypothetical protein